MKWKDLLASVLAAAVGAALAALGVHFAPLPPGPNLPQPQPPSTPPATEKIPPTTSPDAHAAIGRIQIGNAGCSATIIGPRRSDGRWNVLTAAHCCNRKGESGVMRLRDGRTLGFLVTAVDRNSDCAWLITTDSPTDLPFAYLADSSPNPGVTVWHAGYGVDQPGNREEGTVIGSNGSQVRYRLSVSSGDSGGGICVDSTGRVISPVCCTTAPGQIADVWGATPEACRSLLATSTFHVFDNWKPIEIPQRMPPK